tara:strand:+ start:52 stop:504 length:453 start_codon:yes stop_codon:yes gene_type:complete
MACYFAKLNESNIVVQTIVVADDIPTANGPLSDNPCHVDGETYCQNLYKHTNTWKQYFRDGSHRVRGGGIGYTYNESKDAFIAPQPFPSWSLDNDTTEWVPPVACPQEHKDSNEYVVSWDETNQRWTGKKRADNYSSWNWNPVNSTWEAV